MTLSPIPAQPKHHHAIPDLNFRGIDHRADSGRDPASDVTNLVERRVLADFGQARFRAPPCNWRKSKCPCSDGPGLPSSEKRLVPSGITPRPWVSRIAVQRLVFPDRQEGQLRHSGRVQRDHVVARLQRGHIGSGLDYHAGALMPHDRREQALGIRARQRIGVGMAHARSLDFDQHFAGRAGPSRSTSVISNGAPALCATAALTFIAHLPGQAPAGELIFIAHRIRRKGPQTSLIMPASCYSELCRYVALPDPVSR